MSEQSATVRVSAIYICPRRGLADLRPPEPERIGQAARVAKNLGLDRLHIPILEEALFLPPREKVAFLDGFLKALDRIEACRMEASLILPSQRILGLAWATPDLVGSLAYPDAEPVFVAGRVRRLRPYNWWTDPLIIQKRILAFREALNALEGHPAAKSLFILDRALGRPRPDPDAALFVTRALVREIRERERERNSIGIVLGWEDLLDPLLTKKIAREIECIRIGGVENPPKGIEVPGNLAEEMLLAGFMGTIASWLFERPVEVEGGWRTAGGAPDGDALAETCGRLGEHGLEGMTWVSLVEPEPLAARTPPWALRPELGTTGLLDRRLDPKPWAEECVKEMRGSAAGPRARDFIDINPEEYAEDPEMHMLRLWNHFRE